MQCFFSSLPALGPVNVQQHPTPESLQPRPLPWRRPRWPQPYHSAEPGPRHANRQAAAFWTTGPMGPAASALLGAPAPRPNSKKHRIRPNQGIQQLLGVDFGLTKTPRSAHLSRQRPTGETIDPSSVGCCSPETTTKMASMRSQSPGIPWHRGRPSILLCGSVGQLSLRFLYPF